MGIYEEAKKRKEILVKILDEWAIENLRVFPWRKDITPYKVLVAEFLLRRTTASAVNRIYESFIKLYPSIQALSNANLLELENLLQTLGYHKQRSLMMIETSKFILDEWHGNIPSNMEILLKAPNIGPYMAGAILSLAFGIRAIMVDSNVERVLGRLFIKDLPDRNIKAHLRKVADIIVPEKGHHKFNLTLIDLGATICINVKPRHKECPLKNICQAEAKVKTDKIQDEILNRHTTSRNSKYLFI